MSYDIEVYTKSVKYSANYTSNVYEMLQLAYERAKEKEAELKEAGVYAWRELIYDDFKECFGEDRECTLRALKLMVEELEASPEDYKKLNPPNGWGSYGGALEFIRHTYIALLENPDSYASIDY